MGITPTIVTISTCISTLMKHKEFEIAKRALESGADEMLKSDESICFDDLDSIVGYKTKNEFHELSDLVEGGRFNIKRFRTSFGVFFLYSSYVCYKNLGYEEYLRTVVTLYSNVYVIITIKNVQISCISYCCSKYMNI